MRRAQILELPRAERRFRLRKQLGDHVVQPGQHTVPAVHQVGDEILVEPAQHRKVLAHLGHGPHDGPRMRGAVHRILHPHEPGEPGGELGDQARVHVAPRARREIVDEPLALETPAQRIEIRLKLARGLGEIVVRQGHDRFIAFRIGSIRQTRHVFHAGAGHVGDQRQVGHGPRRMDQADPLVHAQGRELPDAPHQQDAVGPGFRQPGKMLFQRGKIKLPVRVKRRDRRAPRSRIFFLVFRHDSLL